MFTQNIVHQSLHRRAQLQAIHSSRSIACEAQSQRLRLLLADTQTETAEDVVQLWDRNEAGALSTALAESVDKVSRRLREG